MYEDGPFQVFLRLRERLGVEEDGSYKYKITVCHWCLSVWVALVLLVVPWQFNAVMAASAASVFIEGWMDGKDTSS